ncbi:MAG: topoisomerase DNA-binding C4 zinc finger domain-containing protein [Blastocatellales bacterium]
MNGVEVIDQIPMPLPSEVLTVNPKFQLTIDSFGRLELVIRTESEQELEELLNTWEPILCPETQPNKVFSINGARNGEHKQRFYAGDQCPQCSNKLIRKRSRNGLFLGCKGWPDCTFAQSL